MEELSLSGYSLPHGVAPGAGEGSARRGGLLLTPAGSTSPAGNWARSRAAHGSSWEGLGWSSPGPRASPAHPQPLFAPKIQVWIHTPIRSGYILQWLCLLLLSSLLMLSSLLLFALFLPQNPSPVQAGHEFKEQLFFCNRSLARTLWELEHLLSGFSSIHFVSGLGNWHKSTLGLEQEEAGCYSGTR